MKLALFDLDNTLLNGDSDFEWSQFLIRIGVLDALDAHCLRLKRAPSVPLLKEVIQAGKADISAD